jgi:endonuclease G
MKTLALLITVTTLIFASKQGQAKNSIDLDYGAFKVNYSCVHRGYNFVSYTSVPDGGSLDRYQPFHIDASLPSGCPSKNATRSYKTPKGAEKYDRGHGVHQNIFDHDAGIMRKTNFMTNIVPQQATLNRRGLSRELEKRIECARDNVEVKVWLGNVWGNDVSNDKFVDTHGVTTPDYLWRIHVYADEPNRAYAWLMPNDSSPTKDMESKFRSTASAIKAKAEFEISGLPIFQETMTPDPHRFDKCSYK